MNFWQKVKTVVIEVEQFASTITSAGAIAFTAVDPTKLPPKYAAIVIGASNITRVVDKALPVVQAWTQKVFADATSSLGHLRLNEKATEAQIQQMQVNVPVTGTTDPTPS